MNTLAATIRKRLERLAQDARAHHFHLVLQEEARAIEQVIEQWPQPKPTVQEWTWRQIGWIVEQSWCEILCGNTVVGAAWENDAKTITEAINAALTAAWRETDKNQALAAERWNQNQLLTAALKDLFAMMEERLLVRDISKDGSPDYIKNVVMFTKRLARAHHALREAK
jgi:hypothetical protein